MSPGERALADLTELERTVLRDKEVSGEELGEARDAYALCLEDRGYTTVAEPDAQGPEGIYVESPGMGGEDPRVQSTMAECFGEVEGIVQTWLLQNEPTADERTAAATAFVDCLRHADVLSPEDYTFDQASAVFTRWATEAPEGSDPASPGQICATQYMEAYGESPVQGFATAFEAFVP